MRIRYLAAAAAIPILCSAAPACAQLPDPVRAMIDAAMATGDTGKVDTVIGLAKQTNPDDKAEIDALAARFHQQQAKLAAQQAAAKEAQLRSAGLLQNWSGRGEIGAVRSSGNTSNIGVTASLKLKRTGIDWEHKFRAVIDYQRSNAITTRNRLLAAYEPNYKLSKRLFLYGLTQYERDRFQGFSARYSLSAGAGYKVIDGETVHLSVKAGPAYRRTQLLTGGTDNNLAGLAGLDFNAALTKRLKLTQTASAFVQSGNSTYTSDTGLEADLGGDLVARLSYGVEYDTNPPLGSVKTDTRSGVTLIYGF